MLKGKVMAKTIGTNKPGLASGIVSRTAAGTAIYEALADNTAKKKHFLDLIQIF